MKRVRYTTIPIEIASGGDVDVSEEILHEGKVVKVAFYENNEPSENVELQIKAAEGELHPFITYKDYKRTNGDHDRSYKEFITEGGRKITVTAQADGNLSAKFSGKMIFVVETEF